MRSVLKLMISTVGISGLSDNIQGAVHPLGQSERIHWLKHVRSQALTGFRLQISKPQKVLIRKVNGSMESCSG